MAYFEILWELKKEKQLFLIGQDITDKNKQLFFTKAIDYCRIKQ